MSKQKRDFDAEAAQWDTPPRVKLSKEIVSAIFKKNTLNESSDVMDFGCGTGLLTIQLSPVVKTVTAVDSSRGMLDTLEKKIEGLQVTNIEVQQADPDNGDHLEGSYDSIISSMTLHHIKNTEYLISDFYRVLKTGGILYITDLDSEDGQFHGDNTGVYHFGFDRDNLRKNFMEAGFKDVTVETVTRITKPAGNTQTMRDFTIFLLSAEK